MKQTLAIFALVLAAVAGPAGAVEVVYLSARGDVATVRCDNGTYRSGSTIEAAIAGCRAPAR